MDEVTQCATCEQAVCTAHQAVCAVDGQAHCSRHLRRTDASRRLLCAKHWDACTYEAAIVFASDEVEPCASCGRHVCANHSAECVVDGLRHCTVHLAPMMDANGSYACEKHCKHCHVDGKAFSLTGVSVCPVCGEDACVQHRGACAYCGRLVCTTDLGKLETTGGRRRCATCANLAAGDVPAGVVAAAVAAAGGDRKASRAVRVARDHSHSVVELDLGLSRKTVVAVRHGDLVADSVVKHSLLGSKTQRG
jgi:hypothetical protein